MRMTKNKKYPCRIKNCMAEDWMYSLYGDYPDKIICEKCPFEAYINKLAEFEDKFDDDVK